MRGLVIKNTGSWYTVRTDDGRDIESKIKGNFRLKDIRTTNPVAVGDRVDIDINTEGTAFITKIEELHHPPRFQSFQAVAYYRRERRPGDADRDSQLSDYHYRFYRPFSCYSRGLSCAGEVSLQQNRSLSWR